MEQKRTGRGERKEEKNMRKWDSQDGRKTERERKQRDILTEGTIMGLERNLTHRKFPGIQKDDPT